jgi:hypothetical protein
MELRHILIAILSKKYRDRLASDKQRLADWRLKNPQRLKQVSKVNAAKWRKSNPGDYLEQTGQWRKENREKCIQSTKTWQENHPDYIQSKRSSNPNFKMAGNLRNRIRRALEGGYKSGSAVTDLGCSIVEFREYITAQFAEGMTWENYGQWHLDHRKPLAAFDLTNRGQFLQAAHYTNYQPLWAVDNIRKGAKISPQAY